MLQLNFPPHNFRIKKQKNRHIIFDEVRRRWITLTPEEWVRQNILQYLIQVKKYPASLISVEKLIKLGELTKRYDIVVFKAGLPWMVIECKEPSTALNTAVIEQVLRYNMVLSVSYFVITNGNESFCYNITASSFSAVAVLPDI